ncbi:hypothetical protein HDU99_004919, partial [Rhizoclosmatium hyalinum]
MDTYSMGKPTLGGKQYMVMFTDAFFGYSVGYLQSKKSVSETLESFKSFKNTVDADTGRQIKRLHGDN